MLDIEVLHEHPYDMGYKVVVGDKRVELWRESYWYFIAALDLNDYQYLSNTDFTVSDAYMRGGIIDSPSMCIEDSTKDELVAAMFEFGVEPVPAKVMGAFIELISVNYEQHLTDRHKVLIGKFKDIYTGG